ncbi:MAG TPA: TetR/AcrR family transcriptional regulator [Candidatus Krumholzibacteria bacterium]|nr:TetR/AcrR family transcriptional regulator [Candidatus Krumholzibacteria bacterium]
MTDLTKERILDAAEHLFAEQGVAATSLRAIMKEAGANMAAIHYHFGSRTGLLEALLARRAEPLNRRRLEMLDEVERRYPTGPLPAEEIVRAFYAPAIDMVGTPALDHVSKLIGRVVMESSEPETLARVFGPMARRFVAAIRRAAPHLSEEEARVRLHFLVGAMVFTIAVPRAPVPEAAAAVGMHSIFEQLVEFAAAGLVAPHPRALRKEKP